uniref:Uncharacterized protein n=1 Tax=Trichuris muris TaxID=70415 RepID=A0A5S6QIR9_TRIMR
MVSKESHLLYQLALLCLHASVALANYKAKYDSTDDQLSFNAENYDLIHFKFLDDYSNDWFFLATLELEIEFARTLNPLFNLVKAASTGNERCMIRQLNALAVSIRGMREKIQRLTLHLDSNQYGGGIIFQGIGDEKTPVKLVGGSAAQSCTLQSLDAALGVVHVTDVLY